MSTSTIPPIENKYEEDDTKCNHPVKCYDYLTRKCQKPKGHKSIGHNGFSDTDYELGEKAK